MKAFPLVFCMLVWWALMFAHRLDDGSAKWVFYVGVVVLSVANLLDARR